MNFLKFITLLLMSIIPWTVSFAQQNTVKECLLEFRDAEEEVFKILPTKKVFKDVTVEENLYVFSYESNFDESESESKLFISKDKLTHITYKGGNPDWQEYRCMFEGGTTFVINLHKGKVADFGYMVYTGEKNDMTSIYNKHIIIFVNKSPKQ